MVSIAVYTENRGYYNSVFNVDKVVGDGEKLVLFNHDSQLNYDRYIGQIWFEDGRILIS